MSRAEDAIEQMWEHFSRAAFDAPTGERESALLAAMETIEEALRLDPNSAELHYYVGYLWYHWPERTEEVRGKIYSSLTTAIQFDALHTGARLYLGFLQFDDGRYNQALSTLGAIRQESLGEPGRSWSKLKVEELIISCKLRLDWRTVRPGEIDCLRSHYVMYKEAMEPPAPVEIVRSAVALCCNSRTEGLASVVDAVVQLLRDVEGEEGGALGPEMKQLKEWSTYQLN